MTRLALACAALLLGVLNTPAFAQNAKVSPSGNYSATLTCSGKGAHYGQLQLWTATHEAVPMIEMFCDQSYEIPSGAATMFYVIGVMDSTGTPVKRCESHSVLPLKEAKFSCKSGGKMSATLGVQAR